MGSGTEDAVLALTVAGKAMETIIGIIPIPVLKDTLNSYARILSDAAIWASAVDSMQAKRYQNQGFDVRMAVPPAAYASLIEHDRSLESGQFYRTRMPLAEYNGLIIFAYPHREPTDKKRDRMWLVWDKHSADGYTLLDKKAYRRISLYTAWYRRTYDEKLSPEQLHSLLTRGLAIRGYVFKEKFTKADIKHKSESRLELKALEAYFSSMTGKRSFDEAELANYRAMLFQAAKQYAEQGFLLTDADTKEIMQAVLFKKPITGSWQTAYNLATLTSGNADRVNQGAKQWDNLTGGEKTRLEAVLKQQIQAKIDQRSKAREKNWLEAKLGGDDKKPIAAGLLFSEVGIVFNHALLSQQEKVYADDFIDIANDTFTLTWKTTIPDGVDLTHATYLGIAEITGYPSSRIQIAVPMATNKNKILEEMIALAEETEVLGNPAWSSCQKAVTGFAPIEERKAEIKRFLADLKAQTYPLNALTFKVETIPAKLGHHLSELKRLAVSIERYAEQIKELKGEICAFDDPTTATEKGKHTALIAKLHEVTSKLQEQNQSFLFNYNNAQKELQKWDKFTTTLTELGTLLTSSQGWVPQLADGFIAAIDQLAIANQHQQKMNILKGKADRLLRQGKKVYSQPESTSALDEIVFAHERVLRPLNELLDCLKLANDKKSAAGGLGSKLANTLPEAEDIHKKGMDIQEKLNSRTVP
ncbi:MAG: hypothetical protein KAU22_02285, partial [Desulfuromonadales bacterium]|nr:hypothetical protein [Desulfuromonadales bacterium]